MYEYKLGIECSYLLFGLIDYSCYKLHNSRYKYVIWTTSKKYV